MTSESIIARSERHIAGGVVSLNRKASPHLVFTRAEGSRIFDADGRSFIDYPAAFAPHLLGHVVVTLGGCRGDLNGNTEGYSPAIVRTLAK